MNADTTEGDEQALSLPVAILAASAKAVLAATLIATLVAVPFL